MRALAFFSLSILAASPVSAEVVSASANGFEVRHTVNLVAKPQAAFDSFSKVGSWWDSEHTYSGEARNLSMEMRPGGCFCETMPKVRGGIEHMRVAFIEPGTRVVLTGPLGPLLFEAVAGVMDVQVKPGGAGTQLTLSYRAAGFAKGGADRMAPLVDQVLGEQMKRFRAFAVARPRS